MLIFTNLAKSPKMQALLWRRELSLTLIESGQFRQGAVGLTCNMNLRQEDWHGLNSEFQVSLRWSVRTCLKKRRRKTVAD